MFSPVESQAIFLSKETPIVSVGLRTAEVPYMNQSKTAWKSEVVQKKVWHNGECHLPEEKIWFDSISKV
jgi:hypothetical protein